MSGFLPIVGLPAASALAPAIVLVTLTTALAWIANKATSSAARRNTILLPTLWLVLIAPFAPFLVQALGLSIEIQAPSATKAPVAKGPTSTIEPSTAVQHSADNSVAPRAIPAPTGGLLSSPAQTTSPNGNPWLISGIWIALWIWAVGTGAALLGVALSWLRLRRLVGHARPAPERLSPAIERARRLVGLRHYPEVAICDQIATPVAVGWGPRARVLLPLASTESLSELDWVHALAHEGAHHAHGDPLLQVLRRLTLALWWWHPGVHRLDQELERTREELADNAVLSAVDPLTYSETLLAWGRLASPTSRAVLTVSLLPRHDSLESRIRNLLNPRRCTMARSRPLVLTAAALFATSLCLAAGAARLVDQPETDHQPLQTDARTVTGEWTGTFSDPGSPGHLDIDIKGGDIQVTGHHDDRVIVRWAVPLPQGNLSATPIDLDVRPSGSTIEINSDDYAQTTHLEVLVPHRTDLTLDSYRNGKLWVRNVRGTIRARSHHNDIVLENVAGSAELEGYNGNFAASFSEVDGDLSFDTYNGHVDLTLPDEVGLSAQLRTIRGSLSSTFKLENFEGAIGRSKQPLRGSVSLGEPFAQATIGDGEHQLKIETTNGDIALRRQLDAKSR